MRRIESFLDPRSNRSLRAGSSGASNGTEIPRSVSPRHDLHNLQHTATYRSNLSIVSRPPPNSDPLGLQLVFEPDEPAGTIVFVHGLGGSAWRTWSWQRKTENFWPAWLAQDNYLGRYRTLTFGYNSNFKGDAEGLDVIDFAKDLLLQMLNFPGCLEAESPILFVAHSMGGLVVKKAFTLGKQDKRYASMLANVTSIVFLATPHRGSQYAKTLNNILAATPLTALPKAYVAALERQSAAIQDINEVFSHQCEDLTLVSFYETLRTSLSFSKLIIVEKDSAVLGYGNETSASMDADHNSIVKYRNELDPNFLKIKDTLKRLLPTTATEGASRTIADSIKIAESILGILNVTQNDLYNHKQNLSRDSGTWLTREKGFAAWLQATNSAADPRYYWLFGLPGSGKTVLSAKMVDQFQSRGQGVQYHFFSDGHQAKRTIAYSLRSIATQLAITNESFLDALILMHQETGLCFTQQNQDFHAIWEKVFEGIIFQHQFPRPLVWILDGVDESDSPDILLGQMAQINSRTPIKVFFSSRPLKAISRFETAQIRSYFVRENDTAEDIRGYASSVVRQALPDDEQLLSYIVNETMKNSSGSFLWVKLALDALQENWHTRDTIRQTLTEFPLGMTSMYERMLGKVQRQGARSKDMAQRILTWATCSWRPLRLPELQMALQPEFSNFINLEDTVTQICGHFITISPQKQVSLIHKTARDFLSKGDTGGFIQMQDGHRHIAIVCLKYLSSEHWRRHFDSIHVATRQQSQALSVSGGGLSDRLAITGSEHPLLGYAACYWAYHVSKSPIDAPDLLATLKAFLSKFLLSWIEAIALSGSFRYLIKAAQYLKAYVKRHMRSARHREKEQPLSLKTAPEYDIEWLQSWATDIIRIVGRLGTGLLSDPPSVYRQLAPFCPRDSMIATCYMTPKPGPLSVNGLRATTWDDCLASVRAGRDDYITQVLATEIYFVTLASSSGTIIIWSAETCEQLRVVSPGGYIPLMAVNKAGTAIATVGIDNYTVWELSSGTELYSCSKTSSYIVLDLRFGPTDSELLVGFNSNIIARVDLASGECVEHHIQLPDDPDFLYHGSPWRMALSPDLSKIAAAWRGKPPLIWDIVEGPLQFPRKCRITSPSDSICAPELLRWHPDTDALFVLCQDMNVVEWRIYEEDQRIYDHLNAREMVISDDGNCLLSSDYTGTVSVWNFPRLNLVYSLVNEGDPITDLAFSPSGQRLYDARGSACTVWEPDALVRADEHEMEDVSSAGGTTVLAEPIVSRFDASDQLLTAFSIGSRDRYYCCGNEDGHVYIHDIQDGRRLRKVYSHMSPCLVLILSWSESGKYMASYDDGGFVIAKRLKVKEEGSWGVFPVFTHRLGGLVNQLLFSSDEQYLLISTPTADHLWDLKAKKQLSERTWTKRQNRRWIQHPLRKELLVRIEPKGVRCCQWQIPEAIEDESWVSEPDARIATGFEGSSEDQRCVTWASITPDKRFIVYTTAPNEDIVVTSNPSQTGVLVHFIDAASISQEDAGQTSKIRHSLPAVADKVKHPLGTFKNSFVFLDHDCWVCTWSVQDGTDQVTRHFFIPKDWMTSSTHMASVNGQGTLCCPRYGDVAIVRNGIRL